MNSFINYHLKKYPLMTTQDIVKMMYQSYFGPGHFISNLEFVLTYYKKELESMDNIDNENLYEHIGNNFIRININPYNKYIKDNKLLEYFYNSSLINYNDNTLINSFKNQIQNIYNDGFLNNYNYTDVHHSIIYNQNYKPHYRVINTSYLNLKMRVTQLQNYLNNIKEFSVIALEGKCGSGKTTISNLLNNVTIIDVDDFFLKKELKTKERLNEIGGNIDYDLYEQCLLKIKPNTTITYKIFDCSSQQYLDKTIKIENKVLLVGVYSYHPLVRKYIDKLCYLIISDNDQMERIKQRNNCDRYFNEWIPLENKYFNSYDFIGNADILI